MAIRETAIEAARQHGMPYLPGSLWATLVSEAAAAIAALPENATREDATMAVMAYAVRPRSWEPPHRLRATLCEGLAARIRRLS